MLMTTNPFYSSKPSAETRWVDVGDPVPLDGGCVAFHPPKANTVLDNACLWFSARGNDTLVVVERDTPGANETFKLSGNTASVMIGEGPRVFGVAAGI